MEQKEKFTDHKKRQRNVPDTESEEPYSIVDRPSSHGPLRDEGNSGSRQVFGDLSRIKPLLNTLRECTITFCQNA